jgi:glycosyltransferase involved in cell wall biosynthesis
LSPRLRIAIDASRTTVTRITGTERYALELIRALIAHNEARSQPHELRLYFRDAPPPGLFPQSEHVTLCVIPLRRAWTHIRFAAALWRDRPDVTFVPAHTLPALFPGRAVVTVHDLGFRYFPATHPRLGRLYLDISTHYSAGRAALVLADSQATADDLRDFYHTPPEKIRVVYPGVTAPPPGDLDAIRARYGLPERYFVFVGTLQPRKNITGLAAAYRRYRARVSDPAGLVLAGGRGWLFDDDWLRGIEGVQLTGYIDEADKGALYRGALALVFPSLYEGFGFPAIEAMHCGAPVIASNTSSLPELVGEAGRLVDPLDTEAIAAAMQEIDAHPELRAELQTAGKQQSARYTWEAAGEATLSALEEAASSRTERV